MSGVLFFVSSLLLSSFILIGCTSDSGGSADLNQAPIPITAEEAKAKLIKDLNDNIDGSYSFSSEELSSLKEILSDDEYNELAQIIAKSNNGGGL